MYQFAIQYSSINTFKISQGLDSDQTKTLLSFVKSNIANKDAQSRREFLSFIKRFMKRLFLTKDVQLVEVNTFKREIITNFHFILREIARICLRNLFPGASYRRTFTSLSILVLYAENDVWNLIENNELQHFVENVFYSFFDPYDSIKIMAKDILISLHQYNTTLFDCEYVEGIFENAIKLSADHGPSETITSSYMIEFVCVINRTDFKQLPTQNTPEGDMLSILTVTFINKLEESCKEGNNAIITPIYSYLLNLRKLLSTARRINQINCSLWETCLEKVVNLCILSTMNVAPVIVDSSPEGYILDSECGSLDKLNYFGKSKAILLCAWRTVGEASQLLVDLYELFAGIHNLLNDEYKLIIATHLKTILCETRHRGTFEVLSISLKRLCYHLWRTQSTCHLPEEWVDEVLRSTASTDNNLCLSRRGAGIPYVIWVVLSTQEKSKNNNSELFNKVMEILLKRCENKIMDFVCKIHSMNILRVLFEKSELGEFVTPYVERGVLISITGYHSTHFAIRNTSALMLRPLIVRMFGVPQLNDDISGKSKTTPIMFFKRFPMLYTYFLDYLKNSLDNRISVQLSLYPILLILAKLHPLAYSSSSRNTSELILYVDHLYGCSTSTIAKIRQLSSHVIMPFLTTEVMENYIIRLFMDILNENTSENALHGFLLQVEELTKVLKNIKTMDIKKIQKILVKLTNECFNRKELFKSNITKAQLIRCSICIIDWYEEAYIKEIRNLFVYEKMENNHEIKNEIGHKNYVQNYLTLMIQLERDVIKIRNSMKKDDKLITEIMIDLMLNILREENSFENSKLLKENILNDGILFRSIVGKIDMFNKNDTLIKILKLITFYSYDENNEFEYEKIFETGLDLSFKNMTNQMDLIVIFQSLAKCISSQTLKRKKDKMEKLILVLCELCKLQDQSEDYQKCILTLLFSENAFILKFQESIQCLDLWTYAVKTVITLDSTLNTIDYGISNMDRNDFISSSDEEILKKIINLFISCNFSNLFHTVALFSWVFMDVGYAFSDKEFERDAIFGHEEDRIDELLISQISLEFLSDMMKNNSSLMKTLIRSDWAKWLLGICAIEMTGEMSTCTLDEILAKLYESVDDGFRSSHSILKMSKMSQKIMQSLFRLQIGLVVKKLKDT